MSAKIEFGTFTAPEKANPYMETVEKLAEFNDENASVTITAPTTEIAKHVLQFQKAANAIGKTARKRLTETVKNDTKVTFTLTARHKARRGSK